MVYKSFFFFFKKNNISKSQIGIECICVPLYLILPTIETIECLCVIHVTPRPRLLIKIYVYACVLCVCVWECIVIKEGQMLRMAQKTWIKWYDDMWCDIRCRNCWFGHNYNPEHGSFVYNFQSNTVGLSIYATHWHFTINKRLKTYLLSFVLCLRPKMQWQCVNNGFTTKTMRENMCYK